MVAADPVAAVVGGLQTRTLQHRSPGAVEHRDPLVE
jgi:hypothetical protein